MERRWLGGLVALAFLLRLGFVIYHDPSHFVYSDMERYTEGAAAILAGARNPWLSLYPIAYSGVVASFFKLFGSSGLTIGTFQALCGAGQVVSTHKLGHLAGLNDKFSLIAAAVVALHPPLILYSGFLMTETLTSALLTFVMASLATRDEMEPWRRALTGLAIGLLVAIRPNMILLVPILAWLCRDRLQTWKWYSLGLLPVLLACVFNTQCLGRVAGPSANGGLNFYLNFAPINRVLYTGADKELWVSPAPNARYSGTASTRVPLYEEGHFYREGFRWIQSEPSLLVSKLRNLIELGGYGQVDLWPPVAGTEDWLRRYSRVFCLLILVPACLIPLAARFKRLDLNDTAKACVAACAVCCLTSYLFLGDPRLRVPFDPLWIVVALLGWQRLVADKEKRVPLPEPAQTV